MKLINKTVSITARPDSSTELRTKGPSGEEACPEQGRRVEGCERSNGSTGSPRAGFCGLSNKRGMSIFLIIAILAVYLPSIQAKSFFKSVVSFATHNPLAPLAKMVPGPNNFIPMDVPSFKDGLYCDNFCVVEKGVFYRSAQLSGETLDGYIKKYGIKTHIEHPLA